MTATAYAPPAGPSTRPALLPLGSLLLLAGLAGAAKAQGAFYGPGQLLLGTLVAAAVITARPHGRAVHSSLVVSAVLLAGWTVLTATLVGHHLGAGLRSASLVLGWTAAWLLTRSLGREQRGAVTDALLALGTAVSVVGLLGVAGHVPPWGHFDQGLWRAASTLTYENATAGLLAPLALLALARCSRERGRGALLRSAAACLLATGTAATASRAGLLALAAGMVVLGIRRQLPAAPLVGACIALAGLLPSVTGRPHELLAAGGIAAGLAAAALPVRWAGPLLVGVGVAVALSGAIPATSALNHRVSLSSPDRLGEMRGALEAWRTHPFTGIGAGDTPLHFTDERGAYVDRFAHNEYVQVLWKSGLVGLLLLLALLGSVARELWRGRDPTGLWTGCVAGLVALALASGFDFLWHLPLIPLVGAVLAGAAAPLTPKESS